MEDFTREQIFQGIEKATSEGNKEMLKIFVSCRAKVASQK